MMTPELFSISITDTVLDDLHRRLRATNWPPDLGNEDWKYGVPASYLREFVNYWLNTYDWRQQERLINGFSHYKTEIDGNPIHFVHEKGRGPKPIPLILSHGWPWTFWDYNELIRPLADPASYGGDPADAFEVIVPSLPGFGFSTPLAKTGVNFTTTADLWHQLMTRTLGFDKYAAQGGDWGALITTQLGHKYASSLYGIHVSMVVPLDAFTHDRPWDIKPRRCWCFAARTTPRLYRGRKTHRQPCHGPYARSADIVLCDTGFAGGFGGLAARTPPRMERLRRRSGEQLFSRFPDYHHDALLADEQLCLFGPILR